MQNPDSNLHPEAGLRLHVWRHPPPQVARGICYGQTDLALLPGGTGQLVAQIKAVRAIPHLNDAPLYASPLQRCWQVAQQSHPQPLADRRLMELDFGSWEMQPWADLPVAEIDAWARDLPHYRPGNGENLLMLVARLRAFLTQLQCRPERDVLLLTHGGVMQVLLQWQRQLSDLEIAEKVAANPLAPAYSSGFCISV